MFDPGTKVILVESSLHKTVGPRKGSIGYITNCSNTRIVPIITNGYNSFSVVASICETLFIRFGFEERGRMERKTVVSIFPVIKDGNLFNKDDGKEGVPNTAKHVKDLCDMVVSPKNSYLWENVRDIYEVSSNVPIVLATSLSYDPTDLTVCDELEFKAWLSSHLNNPALIKFVGQTIRSSHYTKYNDTDLNNPKTWDHLYRLMGDREFRIDCISLWSKNLEERRNCIFLIQKVLATLSRAKLRETKNAIEELQFMATHDFASACYDVLGPYLHNKTAVSVFVKLCESFHSAEVSKIVKDLTDSIEQCLSLSNDMLCSNSGFGYTSLNSK